VWTRIERTTIERMGRDQAHPYTPEIPALP
jgi:hypothetical protein